MVYRLLRHSFLSQVRSPFWERSLIVNILLALLALYLLLNFLAIGYFLDVILAESFSGQDIIAVANGFLLYTLLGGLFARFMVQNFPMLDMQPYLLLPIKRNRLYHFLLLRSVFNLVNLMPLVVALPFALKVVYHRLGTASGTVWLATILALSLANHFLAFYLKRQFNLRPLAIVGLLVLLGGLVTLDVQGVVSFSAAFGQGVTMIVEQPALLVLPILFCWASTGCCTGPCITTPIWIRWSRSANRYKAERASLPYGDWGWRGISCSWSFGKSGAISGPGPC